MKRIFFLILLATVSTIATAQKMSYQLSSHILDISKGTPAIGVTIKLEKYKEQSKTWAFIDEKTTDTNGRISDFLNSEKSNLGIYKLTYYTSDYFKKNNTESFILLLRLYSKLKTMVITMCQ